MGEVKKISFWRSFYEAQRLIADDAERLAFMDALLNYAFEGEEPEGLPQVAQMAFLLAKPNIDADIAAKVGGQMGGAPKGNQNARKTTSTEEKKQPPLF